MESRARRTKGAMPFVQKGCSCKKTGCLKKYCECFANGMYCTANCKCMDCKNYPGSVQLVAAGMAAEGDAFDVTISSYRRDLHRHISPRQQIPVNPHAHDVLPLLTDDNVSNFCNKLVRQCTQLAKEYGALSDEELLTRISAAAAASTVLPQNSTATTTTTTTTTTRTAGGGETSTSSSSSSSSSGSTTPRRGSTTAQQKGSPNSASSMQVDAEEQPARVFTHRLRGVQDVDIRMESVCRPNQNAPGVKDESKDGLPTAPPGQRGEPNSGTAPPAPAPANSTTTAITITPVPRGRGRPASVQTRREQALLRAQEQTILNEFRKFLHEVLDSMNVDVDVATAALVAHQHQTGKGTRGAPGSGHHGQHHQ
eukprot:TRINITY_DN64594_c0_g1_i1.p1 TRINITY_DN64594_c0_g1~~TRINITY_DN64594_c0_g1_i1.p1  ORF type:complete len:368 (+),score=26.68 TRINITY_DN64594_c0_g1_i1:116-1219(+)